MKAAERGGWMTRERVLAGALALLTLVVLYLEYEVVAPFVPALTWALVLAVLLQPIHHWLQRRLHSRPAVATLAVVLVAIAIAFPIAFVGYEIAREVAASADTWRKQLSTDAWRAAVERSPQLASATEWLQRTVDLRGQIEQALQQVLQWARKLLSGTVYVATGVLVTLYILFYFLRDGSEMLRGLRRYLPLARHETDRLFRTTAETIRAVVFGTIAVSLIQGVLGGLIFWWLDLPAPLVWGAVMAFLSLLPMFGAALVWAPVALFLALQGDWQSALILGAWGAIVIGLSDNLLRPLLVKGQSQMHTLTVFVAMLGGLSAFGADRTRARPARGGHRHDAARYMARADGRRRHRRRGCGRALIPIVHAGHARRRKCMRPSGLARSPPDPRIPALAEALPGTSPCNLDPVLPPSFSPTSKAAPGSGRRSLT